MRLNKKYKFVYLYVYLFVICEYKNIRCVCENGYYLLLFNNKTDISEVFNLIYICIVIHINILSLSTSIYHKAKQQL